jgi:sigma-E factor negative regulatory protein RseA
MNQSAEQRIAPESGPRGVVSALADGALDEAPAQQAIDLLLSSGEMRVAWDELHWVGDCLRSEETGAMNPSDAFMARFSERLASEPTVLAPKSSAQASASRHWLRYGLPASAAVVVMSAAAWMALPGGSALVAQDQASPQPVVLRPVADREPGTRAVDPSQLNEYLRAHQEFGATALHGPGAIQAASFNIVADSSRDHP